MRVFGIWTSDVHSVFHGLTIAFFITQKQKQIVFLKSVLKILYVGIKKKLQNEKSKHLIYFPQLNAK